jgi:hypothetical protein
MKEFLKLMFENVAPEMRAICGTVILVVALLTIGISGCVSCQAVSKAVTSINNTQD